MNIDLPNITLSITVEGEDYPLNLRKFQNVIKIDPNNLEGEMREQPGLYAWIATLAANAEINAELAKHDFETWFAGQCSRTRLSYASTNPKIAASSVEAEVKASEEYPDRWETVLEAKRDAAVAGVARDAMRQRQYMLEAMAKSRRLEEAVGA